MKPIPLLILGFLLSASAIPLDARAQDGVGVFTATGGLFRLQTPRGWMEFQAPPSRTGFVIDLPIAGDFDGDGFDSIGTFDVWANRFQLFDDNVEGAPDHRFQFGLGDVSPLAGDFDGDGTDTIGVYSRASATFYLRNSNDEGPADWIFSFGPAGATPLSGDFDGDGADTIGAYIPSSGQFQLTNTLGAGFPDIVFDFGPPESLPIFGDWDGDGIDTVGVLDPAKRVLLLRNSNSAGPPDREVPLGVSAWYWLPVAGQWASRSKSLRRETAFPWPESTPEEQGVDPDALSNAYAQADALEDLYSLLIVRHGFLIGEAYYDGYSKAIATNIKSVSKSVLSALVGISIEDGGLSGWNQTVESVLPGYFRDDDDPRKKLIEIGHLLTMTSGLWWDEGNLGPWFSSGDWVAFALEQSMVADPGQEFLYSTGLTHVMSGVLEEVHGVPTSSFGKRLFDPMGIRATRWDHDHRELAIGGAEVYMTPREMARFGELYLRGGRLEGQQIVPESWVQQTTSPLVHAGFGRDYGGWWWLDEFAGHDSFFAWGHGGQFIFVFPELELVVVATSKWAVNGSESLAQAQAIFALLEDAILTSVE